MEQALSAAVTCTILAAAGPQRSRVLATLYKVNFSTYVYMYIIYINVFFLLHYADTMGFSFRMSDAQN